MVLNTLSSSQSSGTQKIVPLVLWTALQPAQSYELPPLQVLAGWEFEEILMKTFLLRFPLFSTHHTGLCS